jgi:hypothetical protein
VLPRHHREWSREERGGGIGLGDAGTRRVHPVLGALCRAISRKRPMRLKTRANGDNPSSSNPSVHAIAPSLVMKGPRFESGRRLPQRRCKARPSSVLCYVELYSRLYWWAACSMNRTRLKST